MSEPDARPTLPQISDAPLTREHAQARANFFYARQRQASYATLVPKCARSPNKPKREFPAVSERPRFHPLQRHQLATSFERWFGSMSLRWRALDALQLIERRSKSEAVVHSTLGRD